MTRAIQSWCFATLLVAAGCDNRELADGVPGEAACDSCHRSPENPNPEIDTDTDTTPLTPDGHLLHAERDIGCEVCHRVPLHVAAPGHIDEPPAEVVFSADASRGLTTPIYEVATKRCVDAYCHGATTTGGTDTAPFWETPVTAEAPCYLCHGNPPPTDDHPAGTTACPTCHPDTVNPEGTINESTGAHIDGLIQSIFGK